MKVLYCDACQGIIKLGDKKFILAVNEMIETGTEEDTKDVAEYLQKYRQMARDIKVYEICEDCHKVLKHLFEMKRAKRKKILDKIEKIHKLKYDSKGNK